MLNLELDYIFNDNYKENSSQELLLWRAVIKQALDDLVLPKTNKKYRIWQKQAQKWFDLTGKDFIETCNLAELNHKKIYEYAMQLLKKAN